jgi:uncharacterized protein (DUF952 family)
MRHGWLTCLDRSPTPIQFRDLFPIDCDRPALGRDICEQLGDRHPAFVSTRFQRVSRRFVNFDGMGFGGHYGKIRLRRGNVERRRMRLPMSRPKTIYKISDAGAWQSAERAGEFAGAPVDFADGYIHFSGADQVAETAAKHFAGQRGLVLVAVDADALGPALKWEVSRGGALFPHLYGKLSLTAVRWAAPLPLGPDGRHIFPELEPADR